VGVEDKLGIRKVVDTGYSREERERRQDGGARKSGVTHATGYTCRKSMRGHRGRKSKSRQGRRSNWLNRIIIIKNIFTCDEFITCRATGCRITCDEFITCRVTGSRGGYI
jgi:hypothetical protein